MRAVANRDSSEKIGLRPLLIYAQAQTGLNLCATLIGLHLLYFYTDRKCLSPSLAGLAFFLALVLDAMSDPLVGNISDRARCYPITREIPRNARPPGCKKRRRRRKRAKSIA